MKYRYFLLQLPEDSRKLFMNFENTEEYGGVDMSEYKVKAFGTAQGSSEEYVLEDLFSRFNRKPPAFGRSMSVSDTVVLFEKKAEEGKIFFCDSIGFKNL